MENKYMTYPELRDLFIAHNKDHLAEPMTAFIVFSESNWPDRHYPVRSRTYEIRSDSNAFRPKSCSASLFGSCADGTDQGVRLDWYMKDFGNKNGWVVDYCYLAQDKAANNFITVCRIGFIDPLGKHDETEFDTDNNAEAMELFKSFCSENHFDHVEIEYLEYAKEPVT